jgi:D-alanine---D-serine ligase
MRGDHAERLKIDVALPVLHGKNGEDGTVQGLFELAGIPVAGCGILSSALCMDKDRAHRLAKEAGIRVPVSFVSRRNADREAAAGRAGQIGYPLFVKPVKAGSSYGITKVSDESELQGAMELALAYDDEIMIEECISGFEVGCAVMGTGDMVLGEVDEIELAEGFFDFTEKYTLKTSAIHVPARISPDLARRVKESAKRIYRALDCRGFARVDMFLTKEEEIVFNEVNTIPGFTTHSRFPNMMKAAGISFEEVVSEILEEALSRA